MRSSRREGAASHGSRRAAMIGPANVAAAAAIISRRPATARGRRPVERDQVVAAADVGVADEDLRHGVALRSGRSWSSRSAGLLVDADLVDRLDAALLQQRLGALAIRAEPVLYILTACMRISGGLLDRQVGGAPGIEAAGERRAFSKPSFFRVATARDARAPVAQTTTSGSDLFFGRSREASSEASGTLLAPAAWPAAYSAGSLTSIRTAARG